ncbi:hypothetical protein BH24CHL4_BH24CHL4_21920 [soil metagenome]
MAGLRIPQLPARYERWFGPNAMLWLVLLSIIPIIYVGLGLTVSVSAWGLPRNLYPWIDNDYWWHLATGDWIIDNREMPTPDPWLFTYDGEFVAHEWLGGVFLSVTDRIGDYPAGIVATWVIAVAGFWILVAAMRVYGLSWRACTLFSVVWMGVFLRDGVFAVRPQMWTFSFFALLFLFIALYETGRWNQLWVLPPLFLIWFNAHLSAVIGIAILGVFGLDQLIRRKAVRHLIIVGVLCLAGMVVNPYGLEYLEVILRYPNRPEIWNDRIFEWQAPDFSQRHNWPFALAIPMVIPAVWQLLRGRVWPSTMVIFFLYQALTSVRFVTIYVMLCMVFAGWLLWQHRRDWPMACQPVPAGQLRRGWLLAVPAAVSTALVLWVALTYDNSQFRRDPVAWGYPVDAATIYQEQDSDRRLLNTYDWGGYLLNRFNGDPEIYIDGRSEVYPSSLLERYFYIVDGNTGWDAMLNEDGVDVIMIRPIDGLNRPLADHPDWELVFQDRYSNMYVRRSAV